MRAAEAASPPALGPSYVLSHVRRPSFFLGSDMNLARYRTIESDIWQHPYLRRTDWWTRDVFLFLFSSWADDEGRFEADTFAILEGAFSRNHPVTEEQIAQSLNALQTSGLLLLYGNDVRYGFLTGWYEHQYIQSDRREPSSLPPPPVEANSWSIIDGIRTEYSKAMGKDPDARRSPHYRDAINWWLQERHGGEKTTGYHDATTMVTHDSIVSTTISEPDALDRFDTPNLDICHDNIMVTQVDQIRIEQKGTEERLLVVGTSSDPEARAREAEPSETTPDGNGNNLSCATLDWEPETAQNTATATAPVKATPAERLYPKPTPPPTEWPEDELGLRNCINAALGPRFYGYTERMVGEWLEACHRTAETDEPLLIRHYLAAIRETEFTGRENPLAWGDAVRNRVAKMAEGDAVREDARLQRQDTLRRFAEEDAAMTNYYAEHPEALNEPLTRCDLRDVGRGNYVMTPDGRCVPVPNLEHNPNPHFNPQAAIDAINRAWDVPVTGAPIYQPNKEKTNGEQHTGHPDSPQRPVLDRHPGPGQPETAHDSNIARTPVHGMAPDHQPHPHLPPPDGTSPRSTRPGCRDGQSRRAKGSPQNPTNHRRPSK